jgi:homoserine O-acetyltransferase
LAEFTNSPAETKFNKMRIHYLQKHVRFYEPLQLESGQSLSPITVAYEVYGKLNEQKSNAILIFHALTGDSHLARHSEEDHEEGWWEPLVGPGKVFDTEKYYIICSNVLGGCQGTTGPATVDPKTREPYGMSFPVITIRDMIKLQRKLLEYLQIDHLFMVAGGSMGGMQALQWVVDYPDMTDAAIVIAAPGRSSPQAIAYNEVGRQAIINDPYWRNGDYYSYEEWPDQGLSIARMLGMITYQSDMSMTRKFDRRLMNALPKDRYNFATQYEVESYLHYQGYKLVARFDANTYLYLTRALDHFDLADGYDSYEESLKRIQARVLLYGISSDILYPVQHIKALYDILHENGKQAEYAELDTDYGHDGFLIEFPKMEPVLRDFISRAELKSLLPSG